MDADRSGTIEFNEFLTLMANNLKTSESENAICDAFQAFDEEGLGVIPADELRHALTNLGEKLTNVEINELVKLADKRKDGRVKYKEFVATMYGRKRRGKKPALTKF